MNYETKFWHNYIANYIFFKDKNSKLIINKLAMGDNVLLQLYFVTL